MTLDNKITTFLAGKRFAVVGASRDRSKYGNKVLRAFQQNRFDVVPVNPNADKVEGLQAYPDLKSLHGSIDGISVITPPEVTEKVVEQAVQLGIKNIWLQPGAESEQSVNDAERVGANLISGGPCILVALHFHDEEQ